MSYVRLCCDLVGLDTEALQVGTSVSEGCDCMLAKTLAPSYQMGFLFGK